MPVYCFTVISIYRHTNIPIYRYAGMTVQDYLERQQVKTQIPPAVYSWHDCRKATKPNHKRKPETVQTGNGRNRCTNRIVKTGNRGCGICPATTELSRRAMDTIWSQIKAPIVQRISQIVVFANPCFKLKFTHRKATKNPSRPQKTL